MVTYGEGDREKTVNDYVSYLSKAVGIQLCGKGSVSEVFKAMGGVNDRSSNAFSASSSKAINYLFELTEVAYHFLNGFLELHAGPAQELEDGHGLDHGLSQGVVLRQSCKPYSGVSYSCVFTLEL